MATIRISIMNTYWVEVVDFLLHVFSAVNFFYFLLQLLNLSLHILNLGWELVVVGFQHVYRITHFTGILYLVLKRVERGHIKSLWFLFPLIRNMRFWILIRQKLCNEIKHCSNIIVWPPEICIFLDWLFQMFDLLSHLIDVFTNILIVLLILNHESIYWNLLFDFNFMFMLDRLLRSVLKSIQLKA